ncbi:hypothetical protein SVIO_058540 [Streptomyces violaceusniger]|uniref:Uncharacterized protein n=1 Tax=Streptomyces violaceusniger TaxID=68280 RepID=A0A4D4L0W1_STRVO|nr:hypothetical protein SVIO_058540 [Streptomyces violaceusniger]
MVGGGQVAAGAGDAERAEELFVAVDGGADGGDVQDPFAEGDGVAVLLGALELFTQVRGADTFAGDPGEGGDAVDVGVEFLLGQPGGQGFPGAQVQGSFSPMGSW